MIRVIAIDDEPLALKQLEMYIGRIPYFQLTASCSSCKAAIPYLNDADAMFADINMPDITGMEFVRSLENAPLTVFTTAYPGYAIEGYKVNAVDYLLKPFSMEEFESASDKIRQRYELLRTAGNVQKAHEELFFKTDYRQVRLKPDDILYIEGMAEYLKIFHLGSATPLIILHSMKKMLEKLPDDRFVRVHKSYIVNRNHIKDYSRTRITMKNGAIIPVGETYRLAQRD